MPSEGIAHPDGLAGAAILHPIALKGPDAIPLGPMGRPHLRRPGRMLGGGRGLDRLSLQGLFQGRHGQGLAVGARAGLGRAHQAGGQVGDAGAVRVLVAVLTACTGAGIPLDPQILRSQHDPMDRGHGIEHRHGDGGAVDAPAAFVVGHALQAMHARLVAQGFGALAFESQGQHGLAGRRQRGIRPTLSALVGRQAQVGVRQFHDETARIGAPFSSSNFQYTYGSHGLAPVS
jgi:hypothetical protein